MPFAAFVLPFLSFCHLLSRSHFASLRTPSTPLLSTGGPSCLSCAARHVYQLCRLVDALRLFLCSFSFFFFFFFCVCFCFCFFGICFLEYALCFVHFASCFVLFLCACCLLLVAYCFLFSSSQALVEDSTRTNLLVVRNRAVSFGEVECRRCEIERNRVEPNHADMDRA